MCTLKGWDKWRPRLKQVIHVLVQLYQTGLSFSAINRPTARSALSMIVGKLDDLPFGQHPIVCRILRGMCNK